MRNIGTIAVFAAIAVVARPRPAAPQSTQPAVTPVERLTVEQLIDRLTQISNDEFSVRTNIFAVGDGGKLPQGLLMMQDPQPAPAEAMKELMQRGIATLPQLLTHLNDPRKSKATFRISWYSAEFDRNPRTTKVRPAVLAKLGSGDGPNPPKINRPPNGRDYTVAVGDLCFNLIGQIVNRDYESVTYRPSMVVIANSPVLCPDLCDAVRAEWAGVTASQHRDSLIADVVRPDYSERAKGGVVTLWRYYPEAAAAAVQKRLNLPIYDSLELGHFATGQLYPAGDLQECRRLIDGFVEQHGEAYRTGLLLRLWRDRFEKVGQKVFSNTPPVKIAPAQILKELSPQRNSEVPPAFEASDHRETSEFIDVMTGAGIHSPEIDQLVWEVFRKACARHETDWERDDLIAEACVRHLAHRGHDAELLAFCRRRYSELARSDPDNRRHGPHEKVRVLIGLLTGA